MKRLIKFDIVHPAAWLSKQQARTPGLEGLSLKAYRTWLNQLGSNYADFYTYYLNQSEQWVAEEYYLMDPLFTRKVAQHLYGRRLGGAMDTAARAAGKLSGRRYGRWVHYVIRRYLASFDADVIFVRSQPLDSRFWQSFRERSLVIARLSARLPARWHPNDFDLLLTDWELYRRLFEVHGVPTLMSDQGFDPRIVGRLAEGRHLPGVVFCGGLGTQNFLARTEFFERLAARVPLHWWGYWWEQGGDGRSLSDFPNLADSFKGPISGLEMFQAYRDADICLNNYVDVAGGFGANQRVFEVMGAGGFLLTREATNFGGFPEDVFATYSDEADCLAKIDYYLARPEERARIAANGQRFVLEHFSYERIARELSDKLVSLLAERG